MTGYQFGQRGAVCVARLGRGFLELGAHAGESLVPRECQAEALAIESLLELGHCHIVLHLEASPDDLALGADGVGLGCGSGGHTTLV